MQRARLDPPGSHGLDRTERRSWLSVQPYGYACCPGELDGGRGAGADAAQERHTPTRSEGDHLCVPALPRGPAVPPPICGVRLGVVSAGPVRVGGGDGVGSAGAGPVHQEHSFGVTGQDDGQSVLDGGNVVPGSAASDQETERLAHGWLLLHQSVGLIR